MYRCTQGSCTWSGSAGRGGGGVGGGGGGGGRGNAVMSEASLVVHFIKPYCLGTCHDRSFTCCAIHGDVLPKNM